MFAADTAPVAKARAVAGGDREAQILMGEAPENLDKVDVTLWSGNHFLSYPTFLTLLANIAGIVGAFYLCDKDDIDIPTTPLIFQFAWQVAFELSSDESRAWIKHNSGQSHQLFCWWVSILDQFTWLSVSLAKHPKHVMFFGMDRVNELPTGNHAEAMSILGDAIKRYRKIIKNLESVPVTAIATAWEASQARDRSRTPEPGPKKVPSHSGELDTGASKKARVGDTIDKAGKHIAVLRDTTNANSATSRRRKRSPRGCVGRRTNTKGTDSLHVDPRSVPSIAHAGKYDVRSMVEPLCHAIMCMWREEARDYEI
jgi:hypothetical protein